MTSSNRQIGPYVVIGRLGSGGMGEVFLAHDPRLEREVALKLLPAEFAQDSERMQRFRTEALSLAAINHPNIATVFGFEEPKPGSFVLVLERVEGQTLAERLKEGLPVAEALRICAQVAEAIEAAHARGVIHRDLKPGNVMVGPRGVTKVLDFGLAWNPAERGSSAASGSRPRSGSGSSLDAALARMLAPVDEAAPTTPLSRDGVSSGTPGYMSPEQVLAAEQDERTDVFAFGCVLYECLSGRPAFTGATERDLVAAVLESSPDWTRLPAQVPARIRELLGRCLEKDPERRLPAMRDARLEIEEVLGIRRASALRSGEIPTSASNLPAQPTHFVGREQSLRDCRALLGEARLLTLTGVGGCGKTRLALKLSESLLEEFADGVWFLDLAPLTDPERVPQAVASTLGIREEAGTTLTESLIRHLEHRRVLLVLDNCEHLLTACAELVGSLLSTITDARVLVTSRENLGLGWERTYAVPSLSVPAAGETRGRDAAAGSEAVQLFVDRAALARPGFELTDTNAPIVSEVCRRLDGIPLAIELAAARMRMLSPEQIRDKLHDRFRLLAGGSKVALPRHQTLRAAIQWSYDHLTVEEQQLLRTLSVFAGGWTLEAAAAVSEARDEFEVLDLLTHLANKSLVVVERLAGGDPRYRFLETVRQYARDALIESGSADAMRGRHRDWFLKFAERAAPHLTGPEQVSWMDRVAAENDNLRASLEWCIEVDSDPEPGIRLAAALNWFWAVRGQFAEGRKWFEAVLARPGEPTPTPTLGMVLNGAGNLCFRLDDYAAARSYYERALAVREQVGDRRGVAGSLGSLGNVAQYQGRYEEARAFFTRSLTLNREVGYQVWEAANLTCLGNLSRLLDDFEASRRYLDQALALNRTIAHRVGESSSLAGLGDLMLRLDDLPAAQAQFEQALAINREIGNVHDEAVELVSLAAVAQKRNDPVRARALCAEALALFRRMGARVQLAGALERLASLELQADRPERAVRLWAAAHGIRRNIEAHVPRYDLEAMEQEQAIAQAALGAAFEAAWSEGLAMSLDQAIDQGTEVEAT